MKRCKICGEIVSRGDLHKGCECLLKTASGEKVDDKTLAQYTLLLVTEDENFGKMFKEVTAWMNTLPNLPGKTN